MCLSHLKAFYKIKGKQWQTNRKSHIYWLVENAWFLLHVVCLSSVPSLPPVSPPPSETGSDSVHTDVDDQRSSVSEPHRQNSKSSNNSVNAAGGNMPPYKELTPIYVIKNLVVKPVRYSVTHTTTLSSYKLHSASNWLLDYYIISIVFFINCQINIGYIFLFLIFFRRTHRNDSSRAVRKYSLIFIKRVLV